MNKRVEVIAGVYPNQISLDLEANAVSIALQYSIDDVRNIDKKNTNYSKTITLPGTKKNNLAFGGLFDVNSTFDQFNPNLKTTARIVVDSSPVLEGYLQLKSVKKLNNADLQGNKISYEVVVFDDSVDFMQSIGDKLLIGNNDPSDDLDFSDSDHVYNQSNIENAWTSDYTNTYQYPLLDKNTEGYTTKDFKPCFYHKSLLLKIAEVTGYTLEGSFINDNTRYDKEIISWDGDEPKLRDSQVLERQFKSALTTTTQTVGSYVKQSWNPLGDKISDDLNFEDITTSGYFDNTTSYVSDPTLSYWEVSKTGKYTFKFDSRFRVTLYNPHPTSSALLTIFRGSEVTNTTAKILVKIDLVDSVTSEVVASEVAHLDSAYFNSVSAASSEFINGNVEYTFTNVPVKEGQKLYPVCSLTSNTTFAWIEADVSSDIPLPVTITLQSYKNLLYGAGLSSWYNKPSAANGITDGDLLEVSLYLPKKIKQKEIFSDIISRYNVYIKSHPTKNKTLILESRDDYYKDNVEVLDWTQKKDYSSEDKISFLSSLQNKEIVFSYKPDPSATASDNEKYNEIYTESTGDIYGQKKIGFNNDFVKGTKNITSVFSSAPLLFRKLNNVVVPSVSSLKGKRNPVLLYFDGLIDCKNEEGDNSSLNITWGEDTSATVYTTYPYSGHWDNPYDPTIDIHYGLVTYEQYGVLLNDVIDNNLFNSYWRNYSNQISTGKLITSKLYLKETDINFIKDNLNARIFIKDSYYNINKITDYKPLEDGLTTVELLRIEQGSDFTPTTSTNPFDFTAIDTSLAVTSAGPFVSSPENEVSTINVMALGVRNYVGSGSSGIINGNDNVIGGNSTGVNITGDNNTVGAGVSNVTIVGDNQTVNESDTSVINGNVINTETTGRVYKELEIGGWDWSVSYSKSVNHDLSATEWKTITNTDITIINDDDDDYKPMSTFGLVSLNSTSFDLLVGSSNTDYDDDTVNRGYIRFYYVAD